ncbi:MAG: ABC transporter ATP-binding protein [Gemmatimonadaceae bacterium]
MPAVEASHLSYSYGRTEALHDVSLAVPEGALYALLGPNGAGKTTLLQILAGLRRVTSGRVSIIGKDRSTLTRADKARISYVAEGQRLPGWMRLEQLEAYLAPLYPTWDPALADSLRDRFALDPRRRVGTFSRGEHMKAALLCAVAPRPQLVLMDEPFTGMDPVVKDDLVRGLLASAASDGWTAIISSHDVGELELLTDWVGFIDHGRMRLSEDRDRLRERFKRVTIISADAASLERRGGDEWLSADRAGQRLTFVTDSAAPDRDATLRARFPGAETIEVHDATLGEIFVAMVRQGAGAARRGAAA